MEPSDLLSLSGAARVSERSSSTIRRWLRSGVLTKHEGPVPEHGGSPPVYVSRAELLTLLAVTGQQPRVAAAHPEDEHPPAPRVSMDAPPMSTPLEVRLMELTGQVAAAELRGQVATLTAELAAARAEVRRLEEQVHELRATGNDWRDRHDARAAELRAVLELRAVPWWRRLIGAPLAVTDAEVPSK